MEIDALDLWEFDQPLFEGCFIMCPKCDVGSRHTDWGDAADYLDIKTETPAIVCPDCGAIFECTENIVFEVAPKFP